MKILFVSDTYFPHVNGVYYFVRRLAVLLQNKGHEVSVLVPSENMSQTKKKVDGIDVYGLPSLPVVVYPKIRFPFPFLLQSNIKDLIGGLRPDIIHLQDHFSLAKAVIKANHVFGIPIIGTNHFMPENVTALLPIPTFNKQLERWMWSSFSKIYNQLMLVTTPTEMGAALIRKRLNVPVEAVSNGIDLDRFGTEGETRWVREKYSIPDKPVLLYVGRLDPEKHLEEVLQAVAIALKTVDFCFVAVGKGVESEKLERLASTLCISDSVVFTGFVPDEELPIIYKIGYCFMMASTAELQSISTMEAMASGLPVIAVDAGALDELVHDGENGCLFKAGDIFAMAVSICSLIGKKPMHTDMGKKSLEYIRSHDIGHTVMAFESIYSKTFQKNSR